MNLFTPSLSLGRVGGGISVHTDQACKVRASVFDTNGLALPGNALTIPDSGVPAPFQSAPGTVYIKHASGLVVSLTGAGVTAIARADGTVPTGLRQILAGI